MVLLVSFSWVKLACRSAFFILALILTFSITGSSKTCSFAVWAVAANFSAKSHFFGMNNKTVFTVFSGGICFTFQFGD